MKNWMLYKVVHTMFWSCCFGIVFFTQTFVLSNDTTERRISENDPNAPLRLMVDYYPKEIQWGDTIYLRFTLKNISHDTLRFVPAHFLYGLPDCVPITVAISDENAKYPLRSLSRDRVDVWPVQPPCIPMTPNEERIMYMVSYSVPLLEDTLDPFWSNLQNTDEKIPLHLDVSVFLTRATPPGITCYDFHRTFPLLFQKTSERVSFMEESLLYIPIDEYPEIHTLTDKWPSKAFLRRTQQKKSFIFNEEIPFIPFEYLIFGREHLTSISHGKMDNERRFSGSTLGDEIRMTRIVIQYLDTEESKVLDELTEWLQTMNEIQRIVMVQNVMNLEGRLSQDEKTIALMNKLIETIQPFATETNTESIQ